MGSEVEQLRAELERVKAERNKMHTTLNKRIKELEESMSRQRMEYVAEHNHRASQVIEYRHSERAARMKANQMRNAINNLLQGLDCHGTNYAHTPSFAQRVDDLRKSID